MTNTIRFKNTLEDFQRIVLVYKNLDGSLQMGHSFFYDGRDGSEYLLFLYKDALPENLDFLQGWNYLDENSTNTVIVGETNHETAVDDFLCCFNDTLKWSTIDYVQVANFSEINQKLLDADLKLNHAIGFAIFK